MSRQRWFCSYCGALLTRGPAPGQRYARCSAHADLPNEAELVPPDPLEQLPTTAADLGEAVPPAKGTEA